MCQCIFLKIIVTFIIIIISFRSYGQVDRVKRKSMWIRKTGEHGKNLDGNFSPPVTLYSPVNSLHFQPTSHNCSHHFQCCKILRLILQITAWHVVVQLHVAYGDGGLLVTVKAETSCLLLLTADVPAITANMENRRRHTYAHMDTNTWISKLINRHIHKHQLADQQRCVCCAL